MSLLESIHKSDKPTEITLPQCKLTSLMKPVMIPGQQPVIDP